MRGRPVIGEHDRGTCRPAYLGASIDVHVRVSPADRIVITQPNRGQIPEEGDRTEVGWPAGAAVVFPDDGNPAHA